MSDSNLMLITAILHFLAWFWRDPTGVALLPLICTVTCLLPERLKDVLNSAQFFPEITLCALIIQ